MFRTIFFDLDDTILDFGKAEAAAVRRTFHEIGLPVTDELVARYSEVNRLQWERFERGEISRETVLTERFVVLFREVGFPGDPYACEDRYRRYLGMGHYFVEGAEELLEELAPRYDLYLASNGMAQTQYSRLDSANLWRYFKEVFISETTGHHKPERAYFDYCFARIPNFDPGRALMVGDSLTSDILGGINAGIRTCWFNYRNRPARPDIIPDYEIHALQELRHIL